MMEFLEEDNHEAVNIGDLEKWSKALHVVGQRCAKGPEELTLGRGEEGGQRTFIDTTNV